MKNEPIPAVVTPFDEHMGLDIARALGKWGIPVYGVDSDRGAAGRWSKYAKLAPCPDPEHDEEGYVRCLAEFGRGLGSKAVLYPLADRHVLVSSGHRGLLQKQYAYVMPDHETMVGLTTKDGLQTLAERAGVPTPATIPVPGGEIEAVAGRISYPVILKPTESTYWHTPEITRLLRRGLLAGRAKVILCHTPDELVKAYRAIAAYDDRLVVQEVIPGEDERLAYIAFYLDRQGTPLGLFAGRKLRVIPTGFGSASYVRSFRDPELEEVALRLLSAVGYRGLGGLEFKKDPRDERYKLIEFNTRFGMWDGLGVRCGVDLARMAYCDALGLPVQAASGYREGVIWVDWQRDVRAAIAYGRQGKLSAGEWLRSLRGEKMWAIYSADDWRPGAAFTLGLVQKAWQRLTRSRHAAGHG